MPTLEADTGPSYNSGTDITISVPAGASVGDVLIAVADTPSAANSFSTPSGWTKWDQYADLVGANNGRGNKIVVWRVMEAGDTSVTISDGNSSDKMGHMMAWSDIDTTDPFGTDGGWQEQAFSGGGSNDQTLGSINTSDDGNAVLALLGSNYATYTGVSAGWTEAGDDYLQGHYYKTVATAGASGSCDATASDNQSAWIGIMVELKAPSSGTDALSSSELTLAGLEMDNPALGQTHDLTSDELTLAGLALDNPALGQIHALGSSELTLAGLELDTPALGQTHELASAELTLSGLVMDNPALNGGGGGAGGYGKWTDRIRSAILPSPIIPPVLPDDPEGDPY